jgi:hypothetical protein
VIYVEIFILGIREPLANTGQPCTTVTCGTFCTVCLTAIQLIDWWAYTLLEVLWFCIQGLKCSELLHLLIEA